jgi:hypothetical protein
MRSSKLVALFVGAVAFAAVLVTPGPAVANAEMCRCWIGDRCVFWPLECSTRPWPKAVDPGYIG